jgi:hypothetical protein
MSATPMAVQTRPFAVEPVTQVMLPDGIFDNALYNLLISCHYTNTSGAPLTSVKLYLESIGDPGIAVTAQTYTFATIPAGASVLLQWRGNFQSASPGKPLVSFVAQADGFTSARSIKQIFVSQTRYDNVADKWVCTIPEGRLEVTKLYGIKAGNDWWEDGGDNCCRCTPGGKRPPYPGPNVPTGVNMTWYPNPPFSGQFGDLPYSDPWWKIFALIVAILAAIVGAIAAALGAGAFNVGVGGKFSDDPSNPSVQCCTPKPGGSLKNDATTVAGVCGVICSAAIAVACSDAADPIYRGEQNTVPKQGELTLSETVQAHWKFVDPPNAGVAYKTDVKWHYERKTTGATYTYDVQEQQTNIHVVDNVEVDTPATLSANGTLWAHAKFTKPGGVLYQGPELYTICFFRSPDPTAYYFQVPLLDDGRAPDAGANDGVYSAALSLELARRYLLKEGGDVEGLWRVYVYAQEVNRTAPGTPPVVAAQTVGGNFIASAVDIKFDPSLPCPLKAQATILVV